MTEIAYFGFQGQIHPSSLRGNETKKALEVIKAKALDKGASFC